MKKTYWHIVTWVHPKSKDGLSVGDVIGYDEKKNERYGHDSKSKGFYIKTKLAYLITSSPHHHHDLITSSPHHHHDLITSSPG